MSRSKAIRKTLACALFAVSQAACGSDVVVATDAQTPGGTDGGGGACSCLVIGASEDESEAIASSFMAGGGPVEIGVFSVEGRPFQRPSLILDRKGGTLRVLDAGDRNILHLIELEAESEPTDVALIDDLIYVVFAKKAEVEVWYLGGTPALQEAIDLSDLDLDGNPNATSVAVLRTREGRRAVVSLAMLDDASGKPRGPARIVAIDIATNDIINSFPTNGVTPSSLLEVTGPASEDLILGTQDASNGELGCIEQIMVGETPPRLGDCLVTNAILGGYASSVVDNAGGGQWAVVQTGPNESKLVSIDRDQNISDPINLPGESPSEVAAGCGPTKFVVYSDVASGTVRIYDELLDIMLTGVGGLSMGLPPIHSGAFSCKAAL